MTEDIRNQGIGGSDIAAILGRSFYKSAYRIWEEKTGKVQPDPPNLAMRRGLALEPYILDLYTESKSQQHPCVIESNQRFYKKGIAQGHIDGISNSFIGKDENQYRLVEAKSFNNRFGNFNIYNYYEQIQWYLGLTNLEICDIPVYFINEDRFEIYTMEFEKDCFEAMLQFAELWWDEHVIKDTPPPIDLTHPEDIKARWPTARIGSQVRVERGIAEMILRLKNLQEEEKSLKNTLKFSFEDCEEITFDGLTLATYKNQFTKRFNTEDFKKDYPDLYEKYVKQIPSRVLRLL